MSISTTDRNKVTEAIREHRKKGHRLGFSEKQIQAINRMVLQKDQTGQLEDFSQRLLEKKRE